MKNFLGIFFLLGGLAANSQDVQSAGRAVLFLKNGTSLGIEVSLIDDARVQYYRFDYPSGSPSGSLFSVPVTRVDSIRFDQGELFVPKIERKNPKLVAYKEKLQRLSNDLNFSRNIIF
jgi:hypothetical protein